MSDFLSEILNGDSPIAREVEVGGKKGIVYFRRLTAGQRVQLLNGQKVQTRGSEAATLEIDLGENEKTKLMMVQFCVVTEEGQPRFKSLSEVHKIESRVMEALYKVATAVNEAEDTGKS